jgi:predicted permease
MTPATNRRLRIFATTQIAFSFVLLAGAATLLVSLVAVQSAETGYDMRQVVVFDVPPPSLQYSRPNGYREVAARIGELPGVRGVALGGVVPWRDESPLQPFQFAVEGYTPPNGEELPHARMRYVSTSFFSVLGVPMVAGRAFNEHDRRLKDDPRDPVVIVSQTLARRLFPDGDALNREFRWTDPVLNMRGPQPARRIVGVVADVDDENVVPGPVMAVYSPGFEFGAMTHRLFVHADGDPLLLVPEVTRIVHEVLPGQPVEHPATLEDVRTQVLAPERLNAFVLSGFAGVALLIAVVGVAGVLAFSVSARLREFGVRLAIGSTPGRLMGGVVLDGLGIVAIGIAVGALGAYAFRGLASSVVGSAAVPGVPPLAGAAAVLIGAAIVASLMPAMRASRVDVLQALRSE